MIKFYTGIHNEQLFDWALDQVSPCIDSIQGISIPDQIFMVLMKVRLNLRVKDLAARFGIPVRRVSGILKTDLPILAQRLSFLVKWPSRETCIRTLPGVFKRTYPRCRVVIDCTEIFIEKPSNLSARSVTWSNYKHHNTMKILVGVSPVGSISFISECWGGRVSDKELTQQSGFLRYLEPGDQVLGDRGFLIGEDVANCGAELIIPAFTKGKPQLSKREVEISRQISRVRIHVERVMRRLKEFAILRDMYPISLVRHADSVVQVCASLTNLQAPLVK